MKRIIGIFSLLVFLFILLISASDQFQSEMPEINKTVSAEGIVVLELFTSQGCSSCPPADELLQKVKKSNSDNVYTIAYHVDYWNYIGWEDPFSRSEFTDKQSQYNIKFKSRSNYTPQMVINGKDHFVGSNARKLYDNINLYGSVAAENKIEIQNAKRDPNTVLLDYQIEGSLEGKSIRAVLIIDERITQVNRGENRNRTLTNSNIAVGEAKRQIDKKNGQIQIIIPDLVHPDDKLTTVILVENGENDIIGATRHAIPQISN